MFLLAGNAPAVLKNSSNVTLKLLFYHTQLIAWFHCVFNYLVDLE